MTTADYPYDGERIEPTSITPGDRLLLEKELYYDTRDEYEYMRVLVDVTEDVKGGWAATTVPASEHPDATMDKPSIARTDSLFISLVSHFIAVWCCQSDDVFETDVDWSMWEEVSRIYRV